MRILSYGYLAALFLLAFAGHTYFFHLGEQVSLSGFSAIETMVQRLHPENFVHDFPNGNVSGGNHALLTWLYAPLHQLTGLSGVTILTVMIGLEISCVLVAAWCLWSAMVPREPRDVKLGLFCWLVTMLVAGYVLRPNLSNFGYPFFHGQFYGFADAVSMLAIAAFITRRWALVMLALCLGFMIHPTKTLMAASFIGGAALVGGRDTLHIKSILSGIAVAVFAAAWAYFWLGLGHAGDIPPIPDDLYIAYTRAWQYHWYPLDRGLLAENQYNGLSPFLAMMVVGALALAKSDLKNARQWLGGMAALAALTIAGLWFTYDLTSALLIKLALIRASEVMILLVPFVVMAALYHQWQQARWGWVIFFAGFLLAGMSKVLGLSVIVAALAAGIYFRSSPKRTADKMLASFALAAALLSVVIGLIHSSGSMMTPVLSGLTFILAAWLAFSPRVTRFLASYVKLLPQTISWAIISAAFFMTAGFYLVSIYWIKPERLADARDYHTVQLWAKENTAPDALFMVDPCRTYGWREFSERSSIGTPFEWFHTGWLYVSDNRVFERGQAIGKSLGLDFKDRLPKPDERAKLINFDVCTEAQALYYDPSLAPVKRMASEQGVDYFVMENQRSEPLVTQKGLKPVFANSHYRVFAAKDLL